MAQEKLEILPAEDEELEILPAEKLDIKSAASTEPTKWRGSGAYGMPGLGDVWNALTAKSILGIQDPGWATGETNDPAWLAKKLAFEATTPLSIAGELGAVVGAGRLLKGAKGAKAPVHIPEVLPPEAPRIRGLLAESSGEVPGPRTGFIAGPGGVQSRALTIQNAQEQARLLGYEPSNPGQKVNLSGTGFDPQEVKEAEWLKSIFYTQNEQAGGSRMTIPDRPIVDIPAQPRSTGLGFHETSRSDDLPYPLNVVPRAVLPRSTQTVTRALAGDVPVSTASEPVQFANEVKPKGLIDQPLRDTRGGTAAIEPGEAILPSAPIRPTRQQIAGAAKNTNTPPEVIDNALNTAPPPVAKALDEVVKQESSRPSMWRSVYHELKDQSEDLYRRSFKAVHGERQLKASWMPPLEDALRKLTPQERANFGAYAEGTSPIMSPNVRYAVQIWKGVENAIGDEAIKNGLRMFTDEGEAIPFQKNPNYWPRIPIEELGKKKLVDKLIENGMPRSQANRVEAHYRKTGEIVLTQQHARSGRLFPYKLDADIALNHVRNMSRRIAQTKEFGPMDIKGKGAAGVSDIIEGTKNPQKTTKLMERVMGRDEREDAALMKALNAARKYSTITKLQNFTLPNVILGQTTNALKSARYPLEAGREIMQLLTKSYRDEMAASGVWQDFALSLSEEIKPGRDIHWIGRGEAINRGIAGAVGKAVAKGSFRELKAGSTAKAVRHELSELLGEDIEKLMKQDALTPEQLKLAAGRMAERTQGLNVPGNLAHWMTKPVTDLPSMASQMFLIFKKMGYQQTRTVWDAIKKDPARAIPAWLAAAQVGGEMVGDIKQGMRGAWTNDIEDRIESRGSYWLEDAGITKSALEGVAKVSGVDESTIARLFDNYMQAFLLGLPADMLMASQYGPAGMLSSAAGPVLGDISKTANRLMDTNWKGLAKDAVKSIPLPGSTGLAERIFDQ